MKLQFLVRELDPHYIYGQFRKLALVPIKYIDGKFVYNRIYYTSSAALSTAAYQAGWRVYNLKRLI